MRPNLSLIRRNPGKIPRDNRRYWKGLLSYVVYLNSLGSLIFAIQMLGSCNVQRLDGTEC